MNKEHRIVNRSSGNLGKGDSPELWQSIIDKIPNEAFFKGMRILNLCAGTGTEARILVNRLRGLGWSKEEILESLWMIDSAYKFTGELKLQGFRNVVTTDALTHVWKNKNGELMKFDLVIGNPPYQKEMWVDLVQVALDCCKTGGYVVMVTPTNWVFSYYKAHKMIFANEVIIASNDVTAFFPSIAESIGWFFLQKTPRVSTQIPMLGKDGAQYAFQPGEFMVARGLSAVTNNLLSKFNALAKRECFKSNCKTDSLRETPDDEFKFPVINHIWGMKYTNVAPTHPGQMRVFLSRTLVRRGGQRTMKAHTDLKGEMRHLDGFYFLVDNEEEALDLEWLIQESKLMRFISGQVDKSQYLSPELRVNIPHLTSSVRTDRALAEYCQLEEAEIEHLNKSVIK